MPFEFDALQLPPEIIPWILPLGMILIGLALSSWVIYIGSLWLVYSKSGRGGWLIFIPIVNVLVMLRMAGHPTWHFLLLLIPIVNVFVLIMMWINLGRAFGKGTLFGLGLIFFHWLFVVILAFGQSEYQLTPSLKKKMDEFQPMNVRPS